MSKGLYGTHSNERETSPIFVDPRASKDACGFAFADGHSEIKKWLEEMKEPYLEYTAYAERCKQLHEEDPKQQEALAEAMDELGVAVNFARDERLHNTTVLRPNWLANGIYALLRANILTKNQIVPDGVLTEARVGEILAVAEKMQILKAAEYPRDKWLFLLRLMNLFKLSFPLDEKDLQHLVPALLPADAPPDSGEPEGEGIIKLRYEFDVVPVPLMGRFLVRLFALIEGRKLWQRGARLRYGEARARIWSDLDEKYVFATVSGKKADHDQLLSLIRTNMDEMVQEYEQLRVQEQRQHKDKWVPRETLEDFGVLKREAEDRDDERGLM